MARANLRRGWATTRLMVRTPRRMLSCLLCRPTWRRQENDDDLHPFDRVARGLAGIRAAHLHSRGKTLLVPDCSRESVQSGGEDRSSHSHHSYWRAIAAYQCDRDVRAARCATRHDKHTRCERGNALHEAVPRRQQPAADRLARRDRLRTARGGAVGICVRAAFEHRAPRRRDRTAQQHRHVVASVGRVRAAHGRAPGTRDQQRAALRRRTRRPGARRARSVCARPAHAADTYGFAL